MTTPPVRFPSQPGASAKSRNASQLRARLVRLMASVAQVHWIVLIWRVAVLVTGAALGEKARLRVLLEGLLLEQFSPI